MTLNTKCKYIHFGYTCLIDSNCSSCMTDAHYAPKPKKIKFIKKIKFRVQTRIGECIGCKSICEECERLVVNDCSDETLVLGL